MITINAEGLACPLPVVKTKEAIQSLNGQAGQVCTIVDNYISVQNLTKFADQRGYNVHTEQMEGRNYAVTLDIPDGATEHAQGPEPTYDACDNAPVATNKRNIVVIFDSKWIGEGDNALGELLTKSYIFALTKQDEYPTTMLFYNGGAFLTTTESAMLEDLKALVGQGVRIITCGTCLNHFGITDQLKVGEVGNMYEIVETMMKADLVIRP